MSAICSIARTASISVPPTPPSASATPIPTRPCLARRRATSHGNPLRCARSTVPSAKCRSAKLRTESQNICCSWLNSKSIALPFLTSTDPRGAHALIQLTAVPKLAYLSNHMDNNTPAQVNDSVRGDLFAPRVIAVVGASSGENAVTARPLRFLKRHHFPGTIYAVNPRHKSVSYTHLRAH